MYQCGKVSGPLSFNSLLAPPFPFSTVRQDLKLEILPQSPSSLLLTEKQP